MIKSLYIPVAVKILAIVLFLPPVPSYAEGPTDTHGTNALGERIVMYQDWEGDTYYRNIAVKVDGKTKKIYRNPPCIRSGSAYNPGWRFTCKKEGKFPLAGATYVFVGNLYKCRGFLFICTKGCNKRTPRRLIKDHYECSDPDDEPVPFCHPHNYLTKGRIDGEAIKLRASPSFKAKIVHQLPMSTEVRILKRFKKCLSYYGNKGKWVKVRTVGEKPAKVGWVFDAFIEY